MAVLKLPSLKFLPSQVLTHSFLVTFRKYNVFREKGCLDFALFFVVFLLFMAIFFVEWRNEDYYSGGELGWGSPKGSVAEGPVMEPVEHSLFVLAAERTRRKDPLSGFQVYTNGWNISDRHYWAVSLFPQLSFLMKF